MDLSKDQVNKILQNAPQGADKRKILDGLIQRGYNIEGVDMQKQQNILQAKQTQTSMQGNQFENRTGGENRSFFGKARDFLGSVVGGDKLAQGAGMAFAAPKLQSQLGRAEEQNSDIELNLTKRIIEKKNKGEDVTRLQNALDALKIGQASTRDAQEDFTSALPSNKEVIGSSLRLVGTLAGGAIAGGVSKGGSGTLQAANSLQKVGGFGSSASKATGVVSGIGQGAKVGALTGATEGAIQGAGFGLEQDKDALGVLGSAVGGAALGGITGGALGGVIGGVSGGLNKRANVIAQKEALLKSKPDSTVAKYTLNGQGKLADDIVAQEAIKQGVDEGTIATIKGASTQDRQKALQALDILEKGRGDKRYAALNRPSDVIGDSVMNRFDVVLKANKEAATQLDNVASSLKGNKLNPTSAVQNFIEDLDSLGVKFEKGKAVYKGSDIEGLKAPQRIIDSVVQRMKEVSDDAFELHKLKRFIDENVAYGKAGEGLSGRAEGIVKALRANIDELLDNSFEQYNKVNTQYSQTRGAIDTFADIAGTKFDAKSPNLNKKLGTLARRILSNAQSRTDVLNALDELQTVAKQYGGQFDDDIVTQTVFVNELERLFGTSAPTSLAGEVTKGVQKAKGITGKMRNAEGIFDLALEFGAEGIEKARGINPEGLIKSLREILSAQ
jgi:hypothetical protein